MKRTRFGARERTSRDAAELQRLATGLSESGGKLEDRFWEGRLGELVDSLLKNGAEDDINTAQALGQVFAQVRLGNRLLEDKGLRAAEAGRDLLQDFLARADEWNKRLGLFGQDPQVFLARLRSQRARRANIDVARVEELMLARQEARASKDFARSDTLRQEITDLGVSVRDTPEGQVWDLE